MLEGEGDFLLNRVFSDVLGDRLAVVERAFEVAAQRVFCHVPRFLKRFAIGDYFRDSREDDVKAAFRKRLIENGIAILL